MASNTPPSTRVSREEAEKKLLASLINLLGKSPINEITVDLIADSAGLKSGHVLVHRYFESRAGLVARAAHQLSETVVSDINAKLDDVKSPSNEAISDIIASNVETIRRRAILLSELMTTGANSTAHAADSRQLVASLARCFTSMGLQDRVAKAISWKTYSLMVMESSQGEWSGSTQQERDDLRNLVRLELANANSLAQQLGW